MLDDKSLALLGDREAAERLTAAGVLLECPCCGWKADCWEDTGNRKGFVQCVDCELMIQSTSKEAADGEWNTRAPVLAPNQLALLRIGAEPRKFEEEEK